MLSHIKRRHDFMIGFTRALISSLLRPVMFYMVVLAVTAMNFYALIFYNLENHINQDLKTYIDALYFTVATMTTVGFGDIVAVSQVGRLLAIVMMLTGTAIFVSFTAVLSTSIMEIEMRGEYRDFLLKNSADKEV